MRLLSHRKPCSKQCAIEKMTITLILTAGVFISLLQFFYNRSLWVDEAMLALNIIHKNSFELLKPLDYGQVAPILFLQIEQLFSVLLPNTEYGLRIFPLLCFWAAIYPFYKIIKNQLQNVYEVIIALSFFALNSNFILYASEVKQYVMDLFTISSIFYLLIKSYKEERNKYYVLGIAGSLSIFLSNIAPIVLFTAGLYLFYFHIVRLKQKKIFPLIALFTVWLSVFFIYYYFFIYEHPSRKFMVEYWMGSENAFMPYNSLEDFCKFISAKRATVFGVLSQFAFVNSPFEIIIQMILLLVSLAGLLCLILKKKIGIIILTCTPPALHLFLSAFQLYPFALRLILYILPGIMIICSIGFVFILKFIFARFDKKKYRFLILLFPVFLFSAGYPFKVRRQEIKDSINYIQKNRSENENIYVHPSCFAAAKYYEAIKFAPPMEYIGSYFDQKIDDNEYIEGLKKLRGKNWLLYTYSLEEEKYLTNKLDSCYKRLKTYHTTGSSAYLYDFGE
jgi:hypothetical protein